LRSGKFVADEDDSSSEEMEIQDFAEFSSLLSADGEVSEKTSYPGLGQILMNFLHHLNGRFCWTGRADL
jgi:hypothetical protein